MYGIYGILAYTRMHIRILSTYEIDILSTYRYGQRQEWSNAYIAAEN